MSNETPVDLEAERKNRRQMLSLLTTQKAQKCFPVCAFLVDGKTRTIICRKCERVVDAFDAMMELAHDFEGYAQNRDHLRHEVKRLEERLVWLKQEVSRFKGMERRLLKDGNLLAGQIADRLEFLAGQVIRQDARPIIQTVAHWVRRGSWREEALEVPK